MSWSWHGGSGRGSAICCALLFVVSAPASARSGSRAFDPGFAYQPSAQRDAVTRRIHRILSPTITFPVLAHRGATFEVAVKMTLGPDRQPLASAAPVDWKVFLVADGHAERCPVADVSLDRSDELIRLQVMAPVHLARDVYDLRIVALGLDDSQPNAVRVIEAPEASRREFRFAVVADHQLWDPGHRLLGRQKNAGLYPGAGVKAADNSAVAAHGLREIALFDPDFVLHLGDLIFGLDYPKEYSEAYDLLRASRLPIFAVPGNHDAYAVYLVRLHKRPLKLLTGAVTCREHLGRDMSWNRAWRFLTCVYGDVRDLLYADLHRDGLTYWQRQLGPPSFAFDHGEFRFVGINTYGGTPERRHAFSVYMDAFDLHLGAPAVDNYGGYLTDAQLDSIEREARAARAAGKELVFFGHHDPRGNPTGRRYHPNESFPTDPVSRAGFEEWNYDSASWDSDPRDRRKVESEQRNSATALLAILARHGGYYLSGHVHRDGRTVYAAGSMLGPHRVRRAVQFIRTTTAGSSVTRDGYWGYRVITARDGQLTAVDYSSPHGLGSVPLGNLWVNEVDSDGQKQSGETKTKTKTKTPGGQGQRGPATEEVIELELATGLPRATEVVVRWALPLREQGYRFRVRPASTRGAAPFDPGQRPLVQEVARRGGRAVYRMTVGLPAAKFPPDPRHVLRYHLRALPARDNRPPDGVIDIVTDGGQLAPGQGAADARAADSPPSAAVPASRPVPALQPDAGAATAPVQVLVDEPVLLSAERSKDLDGDRIIARLWRVGETVEARGPRLVHRFSAPGEQIVRLTLVDEAGARSTVERLVRVERPPPPPSSRPPPVSRPPGGCGGCCTQNVALSRAVGVGIVLCVFALAGTLLRRRRRRDGRDREDRDNRSR